MNLTALKVELLCRGARTNMIDRGRESGAGPAGGRYFTLPDESCVDIPLQGSFVEKSPFFLTERDGKWLLLKNGEHCVEVKPVPKPAFYQKTTSDGVPMQRIAILHGKDCLASTVYSRCVYWLTGRQCKFCGIQARHRQHVAKKKPEQLGQVAAEAFNEGSASHVTLTTGTPPGPDKGAVMMAQATEGIKERVKMPVHVQVEPPRDKRSLETLHEAGVDTVGIHVESFDDRVLSEVCPMKAKKNAYFGAWKNAVELFGEGQVSSFIIAGMGETDSSVLEGAEKMARMGVVPYLLPLRPIVGTAFEKVSPPPPERMVKLYGQVSQVLREYGLDPRLNKAGCVRCGACSALKETFSLGI